MIEAALDASAHLETMYYAPEALTSAPSAAVLERANAAGLRSFALAEGVMERVCDTVTPQPLCAVVGFVDVDLSEVKALQSLAVLVGVRDPGNVGAILRSADAAGIEAVICCEQSADLFNPKTVRASAGSIFQLPVVRAGAARAVLGELGRDGFRRLGAVAHGGIDYLRADYRGKVALVFGNEAHGLDSALKDELDEELTIRTAGRAESLNVAMAATILCFELARARRGDIGRR